MKVRIGLLAFGLTVASAAVAQQSKVEQEYSGWDSFRIGGYGEMVASFKDYGQNRWATPHGSSRISHNTIAIPRMVVAGDYKFSSKWILGVEVEFEAGGTGVEYEMEAGSSAENGEYEQETEKGGEVALEQFHITRLVVPEFNVRVGHMIVPVGLTNAHHEPINFFGTRRPEGETTLLPSTWHQTGVEFFGSVGRGYGRFDYQAMVAAGANADGFNKYNWIKGGKQGLFEADNFTSPAYVLRLDYRGVPGLRIGGSFYFCNDVGANSDKLITYKAYGRSPLRIFSLDAQYINRYVTARMNWLRGSLNNANGISTEIASLGKNNPYSGKAYVAKEAVAYSAELGVNVKSFFPHREKFPALMPFAHYEYYNPQERGEGMSAMDRRCQVSMWTVGMNWKPLPNLVVKADYTTRQIGTKKVFGCSETYNSENEFSLGIAYVGWFWKK